MASQRGKSLWTFTVIPAGASKAGFLVWAAVKRESLTRSEIIFEWFFAPKGYYLHTIP